MEEFFQPWLKMYKKVHLPLSISHSITSIFNQHSTSTQAQLSPTTFTFKLQNAILIYHPSPSPGRHRQLCTSTSPSPSERHSRHSGQCRSYHEDTSSQWMQLFEYVLIHCCKKVKTTNKQTECVSALAAETAACGAAAAELGASKCP